MTTRTITVEALAEALHHAMCDVSHHDAYTVCKNQRKYELIASATWNALPAEPADARMERCERLLGLAILRAERAEAALPAEPAGAQCDYRCSMPNSHAGPHLFPTHTAPNEPAGAGLREALDKASDWILFIGVPATAETWASRVRGTARADRRCPRCRAGRGGGVNATLAQLGYVWARVGGSEVAHLIPPVIKRASRSVCGRVALADTQMQVPTLARTCLACAAYGGPSA